MNNQLFNKSHIRICKLSGQCPKCYYICDHEHQRPSYSKCNQYLNLTYLIDESTLKIPACDNTKQILDNKGRFNCNHCNWSQIHEC